MAHLAFKCYLRGVLMVLIGNMVWIITEESCKANTAWKVFPGLMLYNLFSFYGYSMISLYILYLDNDFRSKICYFESMSERNLCIGFIWFNWMFPSIKTLESAQKDKNVDGDHDKDGMDKDEDEEEPTQDDGTETIYKNE